MAILSALGAPCEFSHFEAVCFSSRRFPSVIHTERGPAGLDATALVDFPSTVVELSAATPKADDLRNSRRLRGLCIVKEFYPLDLLCIPARCPSYSEGGLSAVTERIATIRIRAEWEKPKGCWENCLQPFLPGRPFGRNGSCQRGRGDGGTNWGKQTGDSIEPPGERKLLIGSWRQQNSNVEAPRLRSGEQWAPPVFHPRPR